MATETVDFKLYRYNPSIVAAILFTILFLSTTTLHLYQMLRTRTWILIPFVLGGIFEVVGYIGRAISAHESPNWSIAVYSLQTILLLVAPALFVASVYMMLGRIILVTDGEKYAVIPRNWLTKTFVAGDVVSFLMQGGGGGIMASGTVTAMHTGEKIIIGGLVVQLIFFGFFVVVGMVFHVRLLREPTVKLYSQPIPWKRQLGALYGASVLILVRCVFRLVEYVQGNDGFLISHEAFLYGFDAVLMLGTMVLMAYIHPSEITALLKGGKDRLVRRAISVYSLR
ncbi:RTA1-domain-containing protein [Pyrenophora teres f. teres]|uniref:RTA1-domain-containing protein n=1 Tax=Pyrenophora teres f. teres TaxID=97479 RepID=A0A6S6VNW9_9PLEO|nr:RTA1-domain-containing protein [Pyrenophora teres f. teres]